MMFLKPHVQSVLSQLGKKLRLGGVDYRVRGYLRNRVPMNLRHEPNLIKPLTRALASRPGLFVDIGVNTGQTLLRVLSIEPKRPYLGVEPQIGCCFFVSQFLKDNGIHHARVMPLALSDEEGVLELLASDGYDEMASLVQTDRADVGHIPVPVWTGDKLLRLAGEPAPAIIKIDVEGAELQVFRGLTQTLESAKPILFFEVLPNHTGYERKPVAADLAEAQSRNAAALQQILHDLNYQIYQIDDAGDETPIECFDLDIRDAYVGRDYVAYPR